MAAEDYHEDFFEGAWLDEISPPIRPRPVLQKTPKVAPNPLRLLNDMSIVKKALEELSTAGGEDRSDSEKISTARQCLAELLARGEARKAKRGQGP